MASGAIEPPIVSAATLGYHATGAIRIPIDGGVYWDVSDELRGVLRINRYGTFLYGLTMTNMWHQLIQTCWVCEWCGVVWCVCSHRFTVGSIYWCRRAAVRTLVMIAMQFVCALRVRMMQPRTASNNCESAVYLIYNFNAAKLVLWQICCLLRAQWRRGGLEPVAVRLHHNLVSL